VLLFHDQSYGIHYEYTMSLNTTQGSDEDLYIWTHSSWQHCSVQCGGGKIHAHNSNIMYGYSNNNQSFCKFGLLALRVKMMEMLIFASIQHETWLILLNLLNWIKLLRTSLNFSLRWVRYKETFYVSQLCNSVNCKLCLLTDYNNASL